MQDWPDDPITLRSQDALERGPFAKRTADLITGSHSWTSSIVFGLVGPWGSGKSSLISMIKAEVEETDGGWVVRSFSPWATADSESLLSEFFATISSAIPGRKGKKVKKALADCAAVSIPAALAYVPYAGTAASGQASQIAAKMREKTWIERFTKASEELAKLKIPILIVADDIDRLQADELLELLKVVRLLGRFPGVQYLLAYDDRTVADVLASSSFGNGDKIRARQFMEKIVQYPLDIPPAQPVQLERRLDAGLDEIFTFENRQPDHDELYRFTEAFRGCMGARLSTLRTVDRYLAQVRQYLPMVPADEINDVDVLILTFARVHFPMLYEKLPSLALELTRSHPTSAYLSMHSSIVDTATDWEKLLGSVVQPEDLSDVLRLLSAVFPIIEGNISPHFGSPASLRRACRSDYFGRYFAYAIPVDDVSDLKVATELKNVATGTDSPFLLELLGGADTRASLVAEKCRTITTKWDEADLTADLLVFAVRAVGVTNDSNSFIDRPRFGAKAWAVDLLARSKAQFEPDELAGSMLQTETASSDVLEVIQRARGVASRARGETEVSLADASELELAVASRVANEIIAHLRLQDAADYTSYPRSMIGNVYSYDEAVPLKAMLAEAIALEEFTVEDLAARLVGVHSDGTPNDPGEIADFDSALFHSVAPDLSDFSELDQVKDFDRSDLSWANRRRYTRGRILSSMPSQEKSEGTDAKSESN